MTGSSNYLLDTNIVLYLLNGDEVLARILDRKTPYISFITEMELLCFQKLTVTEENKVKAFLAQCHIIEMNAAIKTMAINIKRTSGLKIPDSIIAATGEYLDISVLTADAEFNKLKSLNILQYKK